MRTVLLPAALLVLTACGGEAESDMPMAVADADPSGGASTGAAVAKSEVPAAATRADEAVPAPDMTPVPEPEGSLATGEMALGDPDAPLTVIEYASLTCPGCAAFHANHFQAIKSELIDEGLVRFVYRELPTGPVNLSYAGSMLARCAATDAGAPAYFAVNDALFSRQRDWVYSANPGQALEAIFAQVGLDRDAMQACLRRPALKAAVEANAERAVEEGVQGTPTLLVGGEPFDVRRDVDAVVADLRAMAEAAR